MHKLEFELLRIEQIKATIEQVQARIEQVQSRIEQVRKGGLPPLEPNSNRDFILASAGVNHPSLTCSILDGAAIDRALSSARWWLVL
jgi:hypothetical protein